MEFAKALAAAGLFAGAIALSKHHFLLGLIPPGGLGLLAVTHPPGYEGLPDPFMKANYGRQSRKLLDQR